VLLALDYRGLPLKLSLADAEASSVTVQGASGYLQMLRDGLKPNSNLPKLKVVQYNAIAMAKQDALKGMR
jgi:hypothetical protein